MLPAPAGTGSRISTGLSKMTSCGVNSYTEPTGVASPGNGNGQPDTGRATPMSVACARAPAGINTCAPPGPVIVPPAGPMLATTRIVSQLTVTLPTLAAAIVPVALASVQCCSGGWAATVTL